MSLRRRGSIKKIVWKILKFAKSMKTLRKVRVRRWRQEEKVSNKHFQLGDVKVKGCGEKKNRK